MSKHQKRKNQSILREKERTSNQLETKDDQGRGSNHRGKQPKDYSFKIALTRLLAPIRKKVAKIRCRQGFQRTNEITDRASDTAPDVLGLGRSRCRQHQQLSLAPAQQLYYHVAIEISGSAS